MAYVGPFAYAVPQVKSCSVGHWYFKDSLTPMIESGQDDITVNQNVGWTTILQSCDDELNSHASVTEYNVIWRQMITMHGATVPPGTPYELEFATTKGGFITVHRTVSRVIRHTPSMQHPHVDHVAAYFKWLSGGNGYRVRTRILGAGSGSVTIKQTFASGQGSPSQYGAAESSVLTIPITLDTTWREISGVTMNNTSAGTVDVQLQTHFRITSGSPGQRISVGIGKGSGSSAQHYSHLYVPAALPAAMTVLDFMPNEGVGHALIPAGLNTFRVWARVDAGTATVTDRQTEVLGMKADPAADSIRFYAFSGGPTLVREDNYTSGQPQNCLLLDQGFSFYACNQNADDPGPSSMPGCGRWTKILQATVPPSDDDASVGAGYVEITSIGCRSGTDCWNAAQATSIAVAIETVTNEPVGSRDAADFHLSSYSVMTVPTRIHFAQDAFAWGNGNGQTIRVWVRINNYPCNGIMYGLDERQLTIGRAYLGIRFFEPTGVLYNPLL